MSKRQIGSAKRSKSAATGRYVSRADAQRSPATTVREHVAASRASREIARRERAKMRDIEF